MSTLEVAPTEQPTDDEGSLSEADVVMARALQLKRNEGRARLRVNELDNRKYQDYHRTIGREINEMIEEAQAGRDLKKATKARVTHYKDNKGIYQEQAIQDAQEAGVEVDFGGGEVKKVRLIEG